MNVGQIIDCVAEWVDLHAKEIGGFRAAHLMGGILTLPRDATFPSFRDVDFNIVCDGVAETTTHDVAYNGLILEYSIVSSERYRSAEAILSNPELAANLAAGGILADPHTLLAPLQPVVAAGYADPRWVAARCDHEKYVARQVLAGLQYTTAPAETPWLLTSLVLFLAGLLAETSLRAPTHRRCLVVLRDVLHAAGRDDLHEATLGLLGWAHLDRADVEGYLRDCSEAFDRAVEVTRTPVPFQAKFQPHIRPYVVDGARDMIDQGYHREAMFWISGFLMFANAALQADAPAMEKPRFQAMLDRLVAEMGLRTPADVAARTRDAEALVDAIFAAADALREQRAALMVPEGVLC